MIDKVRKILGLSSRKTGNKLILSVEKGGELPQISVLRGGIWFSCHSAIEAAFRARLKIRESGNGSARFYASSRFRRESALSFALLEKGSARDTSSAICASCSINGPKWSNRFVNGRRRAEFSRSLIWLNAPCAIFLLKRSTRSFAMIASQ